MRTLLFGATLVTACLLPVTPAAAQCCSGAAAGDHAAHAAAAPAAHGCCGDHQKMAATPAAGHGDHAAKASMKADCCADHQKMAAKADCCGAQALPADDPAVAIAGLGLSREYQFGGAAAHGLPAVR